MTRLLGIVIANGFSSESRVFANLLAERKYEATVFHHSASPPHAQVDDAVERFFGAASVNGHAIDFGWRKSTGRRSILAKARSFADLRRICRSLLPQARAFAPTVVYSSQQRWDSLVASWLAKELGVPHVMHLHYTIGPWLGREVLARLKRADGVVCVSHFIRAQAIAHGVHPWRATTVHNSVPDRDAMPRAEARQLLGIPDDVPVFSHVGRLDPGKGQFDTIEAFAGVVHELPRARLLIAGEGKMRGEIEGLVRGLCLERHVQALGQRSDVPVILAASDVFVHPSRMDPCPMAILEASSAGVPTVAYDEGGASEMIQQETTGYLVPTGDILGLMHSMEFLGLDRARASAMGREALANQRRWFSPSGSAPVFATAIERASLPEYQRRFFGPKLSITCD